MRTIRLLLLFFLLCPLLDSGRVCFADEPGSVAFFENRIRPVLVEHCYQCHSSDADEIGGSLLLDSSDGMMSGGDSGPSLVKGDAEASVLISAIRYESTEMPPEGKLPDHVIDDFQKWIDAGAVDPRRGTVRPPSMASQIDIEAGREFWAFQPVGFHSVPKHASRESRGVIDQFLSDKLDASGVVANGPAPPAARLRRLAYDLTGLPPDPNLVQQWLSDPSPRHWRRIVDQLLATPGFGEHWARHWMDVARYADSNGADFNATHHEAWRYRDYLIRAFAADTPFDQMIRQQIAGDQLPFSNDAQRHDNIVASTFLMLGTKMLSERDKPKLVLDVVDEQIDTVGRAFLGLTLGCARCHDHKFDPIPTEDYYALAGIFRSTMTLNGESQKYVSTWNRVKLPTTAAHVAQVKEHRDAMKRLQEEIKRAETNLKAVKEKQSGSYEGIVVDDSEAEKKGYWKASTIYKSFFGVGYIHDNNSGKGDASITFTTKLPASGRYEVRLSHSPGSNRAKAVPVTISNGEENIELTVDMRKVRIQPMWSPIGEFEFDADREVAVTLRNEGTSGYVIADAVQFLPLDSDSDPSSKENAKQVAANQRAIDKAEETVASLKSDLDRLKKNAPPPLPEAMAPSDRSSASIADSPVHIRGEVKNLGEVVPRGFLQVCGSGDVSIANPTGSGRVELADWLTDPDNPVVARVYVNRVWMHLMGEGLVRTVDNFGIQGDRPSHPEMLDALATDFVRNGWRTKSLVRKIVLSAAYQRSSEYNATAGEIDPENRLVWRAHRRRLPAESIRDSMLVAAGQLDRQPRFEPMKGRGTLVSSNNADSKAKFKGVGEPCRSVYLPVVRGYVPSLMKNLDAAEPDLLVGRRPTTNVPAQALALVNSPVVNEWAKQAASDVMSNAAQFDDRLRHAYVTLFHRQPTARDIEIAMKFFEASKGGQDSLDAWHEYVAAMIASTEFRLLE